MDTTISALGTELTPINGTEETPCYKQTLSLTVLTCIISLVGLTGNAVVRWLLGFRMRRNALSIYTLSLSMPVMTFPYLSGLNILSAMSTERCLSVLWPIWYRCRRPKHLSAVVCVLLWALSLLRSILEWMFCDSLFSDADSVWFAWLIFLCVVLCVSSLVLLVRILCASQKMPLTKLYVTILLTVLVFLLCGLPIGIQWALFSRIYVDWEVLYSHVYLVSVFLLSLNSSANPIIYFFVGSIRQHQNWQNLKLVLQRDLQDTSEVDEGGGRLPQATLELSGSRFRQ
uniref:G-protein coupled receptors family 1 profile domain-containing protein n=1 Tax=Nomascus leucogenys TaxID=61853 RepID=A0A2I3GV79_NOMLE